VSILGEILIELIQASLFRQFPGLFRVVWGAAALALTAIGIGCLTTNNTTAGYVILALGLFSGGVALLRR
jgi:hypothetical protein